MRAWTPGSNFKPSSLLRSRREDMVVGLGAREDALNRTRAELNMANFSTSAEMHCLARARDAEHRERANALRHREQALEAERTASKAETIRALSISRLESSEKAIEAKLVAKSTNLELKAEQAVRMKVGICEQ